MSTGADSSNRVSSFQRTIEQRVANPSFRSLLRSRLHWPVSRWLLLVSYEGRRSGRRYTFPVAYERLDGAYVVVTPSEESNWWRNFRDSRPCSVWIHGVEHSARGTLVTGEDREPLLRRYLAGHPLLARGLGVEDASSTSTRDLAVVRFVVPE